MSLRKAMILALSLAVVSSIVGAEPEDREFVCGDVDGDGQRADISDLVHLVNYMFQSGPAPVACP